MGGVVVGGVVALAGAYSGVDSTEKLMDAKGCGGRSAAEIAGQCHIGKGEMVAGRLEAAGKRCRDSKPRLKLNNRFKLGGIAWLGGAEGKIAGQDQTSGGEMKVWWLVAGESRD